MKFLTWLGALGKSSKEKDFAQVNIGSPEDIGQVNVGSPENIGQVNVGSPEDIGQVNVGSPEDIGQVNIEKAEGTEEVNIKKAEDTEEVNIEKADDTEEFNMEKLEGTEEVNIKKLDGTEEVNIEKSEGTEEENNEKPEGTEEVNTGKPEDTEEGNEEKPENHVQVEIRSQQDQEQGKARNPKEIARKYARDNFTLMLCLGVMLLSSMKYTLITEIQAAVEKSKVWVENTTVRNGSCCSDMIQGTWIWEPSGDKQEMETSRQRKWNAEDLSFVLSSEGYAFGIGAFVGAFATRYLSCKHGFGASGLIAWITYLTMHPGFNVAPHIILLLQIAVGVMQGFSMPFIFTIVSHWYPRAKRGVTITLAMCTIHLVIFWHKLRAIEIAGLCFDSSMKGERMFNGIVGFLYFSVVLFFRVRDPQSHTQTGNQLQAENGEKKVALPSYYKIFSSHPMWIIAFAFAGYFWTSAVFLNEMDSYITFAFRDNIQEIKAVCSLPLAIQIGITIQGSYYCQKLIQIGKGSTTQARVTMHTIACGGTFFCTTMMAHMICMPTALLVTFAIGVISNGFAICGCVAAAVEMKSKYVGMIAGLACGFGGVAAGLEHYAARIWIDNCEWTQFFAWTSQICFSPGLVFMFYCFMKDSRGFLFCPSDRPLFPQNKYVEGKCVLCAELPITEKPNRQKQNLVGRCKYCGSII